MDQQALRAQRAYFDKVHGVTLRAVEMLSDEELDFRPEAGMRSPKEIVFHIYAAEKGLAEAVRSGELTTAT